MLKHAITAFFLVGDAAGVFLIICAAGRWMGRMHSGKLLYSFKPEVRLKNKITSSSIPLALLILSIIAVFESNPIKQIDLTHVLGFTFLFLLFLIYLHDAFSVFEIREKGIITKYRYLQWKNIEFYKFVEKKSMGRTTGSFLKFKIKNNPIIRYAKIHENTYQVESVVKSFITADTVIGV